ncbi:hypothetical protein HAX54_013109 [Datura stramonium]|uniref:Uncharacterized protein n=1 Tax=Datura stramonium TaxID=4076 RepID=A0ABS8RY13_DATST|nr:hypothetical protein [Datura stramonium]
MTSKDFLKCENNTVMKIEIKEEMEKKGDLVARESDEARRCSVVGFRRILARESGRYGSCFIMRVAGVNGGYGDDARGDRAEGFKGDGSHLDGNREEGKEGFMARFSGEHSLGELTGF